MNKVELSPDIPTMRQKLHRKIEKELQAMKTARNAELLSQIDRAYLHDDAQFITAIYNILLQRAPDENGHSHFYALLSSGRISRDTLVYAIYKSEECGKHALSIPVLLGRHWRSKLLAVPLAGGVIRFLDAFLSLANVKRNLLQVNRTIHTHEQQLSESAIASKRAEERLQSQDYRSDGLSDHLRAMQDCQKLALQELELRFNERATSLSSELVRLEDAVDSLRQLQAAQQAFDERAREIEARVAALEKKQDSNLDLIKLRSDADRLLGDMKTFKRAWFNGSQHETT